MKFSDARKLARHAAPTAQRFAQHVVPHVVRPARVVWNQVIGTLFLIFAIPALFKAAQFYRTLDTEPQNGVRLAFSLIFGVVMGLFGITSFLRARRISRS